MIFAGLIWAGTSAPAAGPFPHRRRAVETPRNLARRALAEAGRLSKETDARLKEALGEGGRLTFGETEGDLGMVYTTAPKGTWKVVGTA